MNFDGLLSVEDAKRTNVLVTGVNQIGKTNLAVGLADWLDSVGFKVIVFDVPGAWRFKSGFPNQTIYPVTRGNFYYRSFPGSGVYTLALLRRSLRRRFVEEVTLRAWSGKALSRGPVKDWTVFVFEEAETYLANIRGESAENILQIIHVGANMGLRGLLITTDLALLDASATRLCQVRFHGKLTPEENMKRKFRSYYGKDWTRSAMDDLGTGDFIRFRNGDLDVIHVPEFKVETVKPVTSRVISKPVKRGSWQKLKSYF